MLDYANTVVKGISKVSLLDLNEVIKALYECKGIIYTCGNGGSGTSASHFSQDLMKACDKPSICISDAIPFITAVSNDDVYSNTISQYLLRMGKKEDILFCISGSGNSLNLINGVHKARVKKMKTIGLLGFDGGKLRTICDTKIHVPLYDMRQAESSHSLILHYIIDRMEKAEWQL